MQFRQCIKKMIQAGLASLCLFSVSTVNAGGYNKRITDNAVYAQLSSTHTQMANSDEAELVKLENVDAISGITTIGNNTVEIQQAGVYSINVTAQVGNNGLGISGNLNLWLGLNGKQIPHTTIGQSTDGGVNDTNTASTQTVIHLEKGDRINVAMASTSSMTGLISTADILDNHKTSSVLFTIYRIGS